MMKKLLSLNIFTVLLALTLSAQANAGFWERNSAFKTYKSCQKVPIVEFEGTIAEAALATEELSTLVFALQTAGLVDTFLGEGNFTVFAPTNEAFGNVPGVVLDAILANNDLLTGVLTYHVTDRMRDPRYSWRAKEVKTLNGQSLFFNRGEMGAQVNNSNVIGCQGIATTNGIVWLIDSVLLPQF